MANKNLFSNANKKVTVRTVKEKVTTNKAGGTAFKMKKKAAAAQMIFTGCLNGSFYASAKQEFTEVKELLMSIKDAEFLGKLAILGREKGHMKDMPALVCAILHDRGENEILKKVFPQVMDRQKMLMTFVQMVRSGQFKRKSFGSATKKLIQDWINGKNEHQLFRGSIGQDPSLVDIIKMVRPKPQTEMRANFVNYLLGREFNKKTLPPLVKQYEKFKKNQKNEVPNLPFQFLSPFGLTPKHWREIACNMPWNATRMNLNTFQRHGVFKNTQDVKMIADKLKDKEQIERAKVFPYQIYTAWKYSSNEVPTSIKNALQFAAETATSNVPDIPGDGNIFVMVDTSGSMTMYPVTGQRGTATTQVMCVEAASLAACAIMRKHPDRVVLIPFDTQCHLNHNINPLDSLMTNATKLSRFGGGGTNCSAPLAHVNAKNLRGDAVIYISDNESWMDSAGRHVGGYRRTTQTFIEWEKFRKKNRGAKLINIDLHPMSTTQIPNAGPDILNVGGFSDYVFEVMASFIEEKESNHWVKSINAVKL